MIEKTFGERMENQDYYDREGAYFICVRDEKVAVVKLPKGYFLLGGGIESEESKEACIHREVLEEVGCVVEIDQYITSAEVYGVHRTFGYFHPIQHYYCGRLGNKVQEPIEVDHQLEWIPIEQVDELMYLEVQAWAIQRYLNNNTKGYSNDRKRKNVTGTTV